MQLVEWFGRERGRQAALAAHLHIKQPVVSAWVRKNGRRKPVPLEHAPLIQEFTNHEVTCEELCPDQREFFALVRRQPAAGAQVAPAGEERRHDLATAAAYANTLADRRATTAG
jgi:DNA-binding transcriptional regulator YdaS (Cro superfamily)